MRHDGDDPYLVVAADKGTATFSDIANDVAQSTTASGSATRSPPAARSGYDHKAMGITARGAWESVKRHFREMGVDTQSQDFTVVGVGDMSGDVFGNGMLLSEHIRLVAAFDHRHIFLDPDPGRRGVLRRAPAALRPAALVAGTTTTASLISRGRRGLPARGEVDPGQPAGARRRSGIDRRRRRR